MHALDIQLHQEYLLVLTLENFLHSEISFSTLLDFPLIRYTHSGVFCAFRFQGSD